MPQHGFRPLTKEAKDPRPTGDTDPLFRWEIKNARKYAGYFDWKDKREKETGIARTFLEELEREGRSGIKIIEIRDNGEDPPDCVVLTKAGERIGIEITELVDQKFVEDIQKGSIAGYVCADWPIERIQDTVKALVLRKDIPTKIKGEPCDLYWLLIHTDEIACSPKQLTIAMTGAEYETALFHEIFILTSYDPGSQRCALIRVPIRFRS